MQTTTQRTPAQLLEQFNNRFATVRPDHKGYTQHAWRGMGCDYSIDLCDIAKVIRLAVKQQFPGVKISARTSKYSMGQSLDVNLMESTFQVFATPDTSKLRGRDLTWGEQDAMDRWNRIIESGHMGVNHYYIDEDIYLTDEAKKFFKFINEICRYFNYDDSDAMTDYFSTNFYYSLGIGRWDRPVIVNK